MNKLWYLRRLDLFEGMSDAEIAGLAGSLHERVCRTGADVVVKPTGDRIYLLKSGRVRVTNGGVNVGILHAGQVFGTSALFGAAAIAQKVTALDDVVVCEARATEFLRVMSVHPRLAAKVMMLLARQLFDAEDAVQRAATGDVEVRLADLLLRVADRTGTPACVRGLSQAEMARMIGASRESVSRLLTAWERDGMLRSRLRHVELIDEVKLQQLTSIA